MQINILDLSKRLKDLFDILARELKVQAANIKPRRRIRIGRPRSATEPRSVVCAAFGAGADGCLDCVYEVRAVLRVSVVGVPVARGVG